MKKIRYLYLVLFSGVFGIYASAFAQPITLPNPLGCADGSCVALKVINFIFVLSIPICAIMVLWGGFEMMTSSGDPEKFSTGTKTIFYAAVGFVVILVANSVAPLIQSIFQ